MLSSVQRVLGEDPESAWLRFKTVCGARAELRLPATYERLTFAELKESQAKKVDKAISECSALSQESA
jgi:hypothetical protein